jgi:prophage DNA circulation protein
VLALAERTGEVAQAATDLLVAEADEPTLCPAEVEAVVGNTRARLQGCIDAARDVLPRLDARRVVEAARDAALAVQTLGLEVISALPPLVERAVADACNHHLLAHRLYGDYTRAAQILRLNPKINAPNDLRRGTVVAVYAE